MSSKSLQSIANKGVIGLIFIANTQVYALRYRQECDMTACWIPARIGKCRRHQFRVAGDGNRDARQRDLNLSLASVNLTVHTIR